MELYESSNHYILVNGDKALFCDRLSGSLRLGKAEALCNEWNPVCLGQVQGLIGKLRYYPDSEWRLLLIRNSVSVGNLPDGADVFKITRVTLLSLTTAQPTNLDIELCNRHHFGMKRTEKIVQQSDSQKPFMRTVQQHIKTAAENVKPKKREVREKEKFERRIHEEIIKMFQDGDNFYYSLTGDLTTCTQQKHSPSYNAELPLWLRVDDRFFWNKHMLDDIISDTHSKGVDPSLVEAFALPVMQGFVQIEKLELCPSQSSSVRPPSNLTITLISRRSKYRAGTRFRRRGVDEEGHVANYVESEQIVQGHAESPHTVAFVQIRGSVPVFWSQSGIKYRPPIKLEKKPEENQAAFKKHFFPLLDHYEKVVVVTLVDTGTERSERKISDAYLSNLILYNNPRISCILFDFHEYCRGMHFENASILLKGITDIFKDMKYCWVDRKGIICEQKSVFRINCVDCLDRTNVVQGMFAGVVLETQLRKLGMLYPEESLPTSFHRTIQDMWANNGDAISRQYAGTIAMKGDYTRTGERTMNGLMRDGVSSMNRYYLRFREISRQAAIDLLLGAETSHELHVIRSGADDDALLLKQKEENIRMLTEQCRKLCLDPSEDNLAESILTASNENEKEMQEMNTVLLITNKNLYFIRTDCLDERKPICMRIPLYAIEKLEMGLEPAMFRSRHYTMRIHYNDLLNNSHFLAFRQPSLRLFNNILVTVKTPDDAVESLRAVSSGVIAAVFSTGRTISFEDHDTKLDRIRSKPSPTEYLVPIPASEFYSCLRTTTSGKRAGMRKQTSKGRSIDDPDVEHRQSNMDQIRQKFIRMKDKLWRPSVNFSDIRFRIGLRNRDIPSHEVASKRRSTSESPVRKDLTVEESAATRSCEPSPSIDRKIADGNVGSSDDDLFVEDDSDLDSEEEDSMSDTEVAVFSRLLLAEGEELDPGHRRTRSAQHQELGGLKEQSLNRKESSSHDAISRAGDPSANQEVLLSSCGIVAARSGSTDETVDPLALAEDSFQAADVARLRETDREHIYQRRLERISRQLSLAEFEPPKAEDPKVVFTTGPNTIFPVIDEGEASPIMSTTSAHEKRKVLTSRTMKMSFSETALSSRSGPESSESIRMTDDGTHNALYGMQIPKINLANTRITERMSKKQVEQALAIEMMRKSLCPDEDLKVSMVIF